MQAFSNIIELIANIIESIMKYGILKWIYVELVNSIQNFSPLQ